MKNFFKILSKDAAGVSKGPGGMCAGKTASAASGLVMAVCAMFALGSCTNDYAENEGRTTAYVELNIVVPPATEVERETRHGDPVAGTTEESRITNLAFFAFKADNSLELYKAIEIYADNSSDDPMWDSNTSSLRLLLTVGTKTIYAIANWTSAMPDISGINTIAGLENLVRTHTSVPINPPVMTAKITPDLQGGDMGIPVQLTRQVARVTVYPMKSNLITDANIYIEGIKLTGIASQSYVFPRSSSPLTTVWSQPGFTGTSTVVTAENKGMNPSLYGNPVYLPEFFGTVNDHTSMVIKAKYNGTDTYYKISINGQTGAVPSLYAIERNHSYKYYVTIQGIGSATAVFPARPSLTEPGVANITYELDIE